LERFALFWKAYPRHTGTGGAKKAFLKWKPSQELTERMIRAVEISKQSEQWQRDDGQFVPLAATWLNQERWKDEPAATETPQDKARKAKEKEERDARMEKLHIDSFREGTGL
jgi:hypothetical protein